MEIPFCGPAYKSESLILSAEQCVNLYLRPFDDMGAKKIALFGTPGLELLLYPGGGTVAGETRAMLRYGAYLYVVMEDKFYRIDSASTVVEMGTLLTASGMVGIDTNGLDIIIVDGPYGYVYQIGGDNEFVQITDVDFPGGDNVAQIDGYYIVNKPGTGQIWRSDWNNGLSWGGLAFSTAGGASDNIVALLADHRDLWIFGEETIELWYNSGAAIINFERIEGAFIEMGCMGKFARAKANNAVYWLGRDVNGQGQVFQSEAHVPVVISTFAIDYQISQYATISDAVMWTYTQLGHSFVVLTFPSANVTWVYDSVTGYWHQRSSLLEGAEGRWRPTCHALFNGNHIVGDYANGKLYKMRTDVYDEDGAIMLGTRTTAALRESQNRITVNRVQVITEPGVGLITGADEDVNPVILFSWSRNGGRTWSVEEDVPLSVGAIGEVENRSIIRQLGQGVNWVFRVKISAAVKRVILGAVADVTEDDQ